MACYNACSMNDAFGRLYETKLALLAEVATVVGVVLLCSRIG